MKIYENFKSVFLFLQKERYAAPGRRQPIGSSKFYADIRRGLFPVQNKNHIKETEVASYIHSAKLVRLVGNAENLDRLAAAEKKARIDLMETKRRAAEFAFKKDQGLYMLREDVYCEFALKWATMEAVFKNLVATGVPGWLEFADGNLSKSQALREKIHSEIDTLFNELAHIEELQITLRPECVDRSDEDPE